MKAAKAHLARDLERPDPAVRFYLFHGPDEAGSRALALKLLRGLGDAEKFIILGQSIRSDPTSLTDEAGAMARQPLVPLSEARFDRGATSLAASGPVHLPAALDPRRHPVTLVAILLAAFVTGGLIPVALAMPPGSVRSSARWRALTRSR